MRLLSSAWAGCAASPSGRLVWVGIDPPSPPAFAADSLTAGRTARTTACARPSKLPPMGPARLCGRTLNLPPSPVCLPLRIRNACLLLPPAAACRRRLDAAPALLLSADTRAARRWLEGVCRTCRPPAGLRACLCPLPAPGRPPTTMGACDVPRPSGVITTRGCYIGGRIRAPDVNSGKRLLFQP